MQKLCGYLQTFLLGKNKLGGLTDYSMVVKNQGHCDLTKYVLSSKSRIHSVFVTKMHSKQN